MPKITHIETISLNIPLKSPLKWGKNHELPALAHVLIRVTLSDGAQGIAEATPRPTIYGETQASVHTIVRDYLTPIALHTDINTLDDINHLDTQFALIKNNNTAKGALNIAIHDALAQSQGVTLRALIHATQPHTRVSYIVGTGDIDTVLQDVSDIYHAGVRVFKVKIGKDITQERETIRILQQTFPDADYYVDANQALSEDTAQSILDDLHTMGVTYCEEALPVNYLQQRHELHTHTTMPIIGDDSCFTADDVTREINFNTLDIINIKTARTGFSHSHRIHQLAQQAGKGIMIGSQASALIGCMQAAIFSGKSGINYPTECSFYLKTREEYTHTPIIRDGYLSVEDAENALNVLRETLI